jgi:hypothetical protein
MDAAYFVTTLGLIPYLASRALLPLFVTALLLRFGPEWSFLTDVVGVTPVVDLPTWLTSDGALWALGLGALVEAFLQREPSIREQLSLTEAQVKAVLAVAICLVLTPVGDATLALGGTLSFTTPAVESASVMGDVARYPWAVGIGVLVWMLAAGRLRMFAWLAEMDEGDDLGLQRLLAWLEDAVGVLGVVLVVVLPLLAAGAALAAVVASWLIARALQGRETAQQVPCVQCSAPLAPSAPHCPECRTKQPSPRAVGLLGRPLNSAAPSGHPMDLKRHKRCSYCGTRLRGNGVTLRCERCNTPAFSSKQAVEAYVSALGRQVPLTLVVLAALGSIPVFGLLVGVLYYRLTVVAALRQYTPPSTHILGRWLLRAVNGVLLLLQPIPMVGIVVLPLMALTNVAFYSRKMLHDAQSLRPMNYSETLKS